VTQGRRTALLGNKNGDGKKTQHQAAVSFYGANFLSAQHLTNEGFAKPLFNASW
jgi:hypothetical protein